MGKKRRKASKRDHLGLWGPAGSRRSDAGTGTGLVVSAESKTSTRIGIANAAAIAARTSRLIHLERPSSPARTVCARGEAGGLGPGHPGHGSERA